MSMARLALIVALLGIGASVSGQELRCCSTDTTSQLVLSEINLREATLSNVLEYVRERVKNEHGVELEIIVDLKPPSVEVSEPSGMDDEEQRVMRQLETEVRNRRAKSLAAAKPSSDRKLTLSLRNIPVCDALAYITQVSGVGLTCMRRGHPSTLGRPSIQMVGRVYKIRPEGWKELERILKSERQRQEAAENGVFFDFAEMSTPYAYSLLPERRLVLAIDSDLASFEKELKNRGWLAPAN